jgi:hypothetical protein
MMTPVLTTALWAPGLPPPITPIVPTLPTQPPTKSLPGMPTIRLMLGVVGG